MTVRYSRNKAIISDLKKNNGDARAAFEFKVSKHSCVIKTEKVFTTQRPKF